MTSPQQALALMNGEFIRTQAGHFANRVIRETPKPTDRINAAWRLAYLRLPTSDEHRLAEAFLTEQTAIHRAKVKDADLAALTNLCQQLLASNEFLYVD